MQFYLYRFIFIYHLCKKYSGYDLMYYWALHRFLKLLISFYYYPFLWTHWQPIFPDGFPPDINIFWCSIWSKYDTIGHLWSHEYLKTRACKKTICSNRNEWKIFTFSYSTYYSGNYLIMIIDILFLIYSNCID